MTALNQDFNIYTGNDQRPIITVYGNAADTDPLDISSAKEIEWILYDRYGAVKMTKTKTAGDITFVNTGSDGKLAIKIGNDDASSLDIWWHSHRVRVTDALGNISTVETGRALVVDDSKGG